jgi:CubicO group peptidase (beta-lactamase class C family)
MFGAVLAMIFHEKQYIDIDKPVNNYLKIWKLPENEWTKEQPVTTRQILAHFSGINVPTYRGYYLEEPIPSLLDILEGKDPSFEPAIKVEEPVNEQFIYSTGAFAVLELLLEDVSKENFETLVHQEILQPLNMHRTFFAQPLPECLGDNAACGHRSDGQTVAGNWFAYPTLAGSGIWTTPTDLAKFALHLQRILSDKCEGIIASQNLAEMLESYREPYFGLGFALYCDKGPGTFFGHTGNTEGFRAMSIAHKTNGCGAFILANSDNADILLKTLINKIAADEGWKDFYW